MIVQFLQLFQRKPKSNSSTVIEVCMEEIQQYRRRESNRSLQSAGSFYHFRIFLTRFLTANSGVRSFHLNHPPDQ